MNTQQAMQIIKQALDATVKAGVCINLDNAAILAQAWQIISQSLPKDK
jgi:hypothetical protein